MNSSALLRHRELTNLKKTILLAGINLAASRGTVNSFSAYKRREWSTKVQTACAKASKVWAGGCDSTELETALESSWDVLASVDEEMSVPLHKGDFVVGFPSADHAQLSSLVIEDGESADGNSKDALVALLLNVK